jgi:hypothetical protein
MTEIENILCETILVPDYPTKTWKVLPDSPPIKFVLYEDYIEIFANTSVEDEFDDEETGLKNTEKRRYYTHQCILKKHIAYIECAYDHKHGCYDVSINNCSGASYRSFFPIKKEAEEHHKKLVAWLLK